MAGKDTSQEHASDTPAVAEMISLHGCARRPHIDCALSTSVVLRSLGVGSAVL